MDKRICFYFFYYFIVTQCVTLNKIPMTFFGIVHLHFENELCLLYQLSADASIGDIDKKGKN